MGSLTWCHLGRVSYRAAREIQEDLAERRRSGDVGDVVLTLEHPPIVTVGRGWPDEIALGALAGARAERVSRGGGPTYHGPGQLVVYPVVALRQGGRGVRGFVAAMEAALCAAARSFGSDATVRPDLPGVWWTPVSGTWRKIGSIGLGVRRGITLHGASLNLTRGSEEGFRGFSPCGLAGVEAASIESTTRLEVPTLECAGARVAAELAHRLDLDAGVRPAFAAELGAGALAAWLSDPARAGDAVASRSGPRQEREATCP